MLETLAAIAIGSIIRPETQLDGWTAAWAPHQMSLPTEGRILPAATSPSEARSLARADSAMTREDWLLSEIAAYRLFSDGWDGHDSSGPKAEHVSAAEAFVKLLPSGLAIPKPMMSGAGEVGFYWRDDNILADAMIEDNDTFSFFARSKQTGKEAFLDAMPISEASVSAMKKAFHDLT